MGADRRQREDAGAAAGAAPPRTLGPALKDVAPRAGRDAERRSGVLKSILMDIERDFFTMARGTER